ncbi:hypothetical protein HK100_004599 [Physocladia obscura]|uniref:peptidylprolyl isomerase n=1 Tax=Physocladia obscura TaxID=109957 RepID=A0AAD5SV71_9FUNG|nr:hypothetical protein HK100_004599 [Physocladia obscura]
MPFLASSFTKPASEIAIDCTALDAFLEDRSYIVGWTPSQADVAVFEALEPSPPSESDHPHASRWFRHIQSLRKSFTKLPKTGKSLAEYGSFVKAVESSLTYSESTIPAAVGTAVPLFAPSALQIAAAKGGEKPKTWEANVEPTWEDVLDENMAMEDEDEDADADPDSITQSAEKPGAVALAAEVSQNVDLLLPSDDAPNAYAYFDITIADAPAGRIVFELYRSVVPRTVDNFLTLCKGDQVSKVSGKLLAYAGSTFHRVIKGFMCQGGDFTNHNGTGGESIYGEKFDDESFELKHDSAWLLSMANSGKNTNGSQFFITTAPKPHLDNKHVVFGRVLKGVGIVRAMESCETNDDKPTAPIAIASCGEYTPALRLADETAAANSGDTYEDYPEDDGGISAPDAVRIAGEVKNVGTWLFKDGEYALAKGKYEKAVRYLDAVGLDLEDSENVEVSVRKEWVALKVACLLNVAMCALKLSQHVSAISECTNVLATRERLTSRTDGLESVVTRMDAAKALFRRGQARIGVKEYEGAVEDLAAAVALAPEDKVIARELGVARRAVREGEEKVKKMYAKMFGIVKDDVKTEQ